MEMLKVATIGTTKKHQFSTFSENLSGNNDRNRRGTRAVIDSSEI